LGISQTRASRGLKILYEAGFLKLRTTGLWSQYSLLNKEMPQTLVKIIEAVRAALAGNQLIAEDRQQLERVKGKNRKQKV